MYIFDSITKTNIILFAMRKTILLFQRNAVWLILFALIVIGCNKPDLKKITGTVWDPSVAVPLGYADFGVYDVLASKDSNDLLVVNPLDGDIALTYSGELASVSAQEIIQLNDLSHQFGLSPVVLGLVSVGSFSTSSSSSTTENIDLSIPNGVELHAVNFNAGNLDINVSTTLEHDLVLNLTFVDLESNGSPVTKVMNLTYGGSVPQTATSSINLASILADFTAGGSTINRLRVDCDVMINGTGQPISGSESLDFTIGISNMSFENVTGYFGQQSLASASDSILMKIFNNAVEGTFSFTNPSLKFIINNSFGIPIDMNFSNLQTVNSATGQVTALSGYPSLLVINSPSTMGQTATTTLTLNSSNTANMSSIITQTPKYFNYTVSATANPGGQIGPLNFIESTSRMVVNAEITLPMEGYAYDFTANDTLPFSFAGDVNGIESVMFRFNTTNGFPVSFQANAAFVDENFNPIFTLTNTPKEVVTAAPVDGAGKVTSSVNKITDFTIDKSKSLLLNQVKHVIIYATAATTSPQTTVVKFYDDYRIKLKFGMQVHLKANL
jgi:hypothetical protein